MGECYLWDWSHKLSDDKNICPIDVCNEEENSGIERNYGCKIRGQKCLHATWRWYSKWGHP